MAVHITGTMGLPSGDIYPNCTMYFERSVGVVSQGGFAVVPEKTTVTSNGAALVDFYLLFGNYIGTIQTTLGVIKFQFSVLDVATATFTSCIGNITVPIPDASVAAAAASATAAAASAALADADRVQTGADRVQTGLDVVSTSAARDAAIAGSILTWPTTAAGIGQGIAGVTSIVGGSGGANGTFALAYSGGTQVLPPVGVFTVAGGALVSVVITYRGYYSSGTPTLSFAASTGLTGASATAQMAANTPVNGYFALRTTAMDALGEAAKIYQNVAGVATLITTEPSMVRMNAIYAKEIDTHSRGGNYDEKFAFLDLASQTVTNIQDAAAVTSARTLVSTGLQIALSTARLCAFTTQSKVGTVKTRVRSSAAVTYSGACITGISMRNGADRFRIDVASTNGWITYSNSRGGSGILTQSAYAYPTGSVIEFDMIVDPVAQTAHIKVTVAGRAPFVFGFTNVPCGAIDLIQDETGTSIIYSMQVETIDDFQKNTALAAPVLTNQQKGELFATTAFMAGYQRVAPAGFSGRFEDYLKIYSQPVSGNFVINFSPNPLFDDDDPEPARLYVDIATGSDTGAGSAAAPLKSINVAIARCGASSKAKLYVKGGIYPYLNSWKSVVLGAGSRVEVVSWDGLPVISSVHDNLLVWTLDTDSTYFATFTDTCLNVFDAANLTSDGDYGRLTLASSLAVCKATAGSFFVTGATVYVHTFNNRAPDASIRAYRGGSFDFGNGYVTGLNSTLYIENIQFEGGKFAFYASLSSASASGYIYGKSCSFKYASQGSSPSTNGAWLAIWEECVAAWNQGDGFHQNPIFSSVPGDSIELNCIGRWNGVNAGGVGNNSSNHGGSTIRVKTKAGWGDYHHSEARGIHDIMETENSLSWCLGITSRDSLNGFANFSVGLNGETGTSLMWLDKCTSSGATIDLQANAAAIIYTSNLTSGGVNSGTGTVTGYTP